MHGQALTVPYTQFKLPNGLNVILHRDTSVPVVSVNIWYHVGSGNERPGRTGFAHLFEHVMFEGSMHVPEGVVRHTGSRPRAATTTARPSTDRTNYYEDLPANALELALFLESDRMGFLLDDKAPDKINGQRDVVKNEKRQSVRQSAVWPGLHRTARRCCIRPGIPTAGRRLARWKT